jgi:small membrane protein
MIPIQPLLILLLGLILLVYLTRFRSMFLDRMIVIGFSGLAILLVSRPDLSNRIANRLGVGRGVDLISYLAIPGLLFMILLLYAKAMRQEERMAVLTRELALVKAEREGRAI